MNKIERLKQINAEHSRMFCDSEAQGVRRKFRGRHPVGLFVFGCMDGRNNISNATEIPVGIIKNYRELGGRWEWWNYIDLIFYKDLMYWINQGKDCLVFVSYHFSKSSPSLGCAGFGYDVDAAIKSNIIFKKKIENVYGVNRLVVFPILLGLETDEEALIIHGNNPDRTLRVADLAEYDEDYIKSVLSQMFKAMQPEIMSLMLCLIAGNIRHIAKIRASHRPLVTLNHCEWVVAIGQGLDWFYQPNQAIIVGMYSNRPEESIVKAVDIIEKNIIEGRVPRDEGFVLLASSSFRSEAGSEKSRACERALENMRFAQKIIRKNHSHLFDVMQPLVTVTNLDNRKFTEVKNIDLSY